LENTITNRQLDFTIPCDAFIILEFLLTLVILFSGSSWGATTINNLVVANFRENSKLAIVIDSEGSSTTRNSNKILLVYYQTE
jgi:hypothetical protein